MTDQPSPDYSPLSDEQLSALNETQKAIFLQLDSFDRHFFGENFSPITLGKALERKWEVVQSRRALDEHDQRVRARFANGAQGRALPLPDGTADKLTPTDLALGAGGLAGLVGMGVLASKIAPQGKAYWRGVQPRDLVEPLVKTFARQKRTDIRFESPDSGGTIHGQVLLRTGSGLLPGLNIVLTPLDEGAQVHVSKISSQSMLESVKAGGVNLLGLVKDALRFGRSGDPGDLLDLAGQVVEHGAEIAKAVDDLDLEDKAWETVQRTSEALQAIYDEKMLLVKDRRLKLEMAWDDYRSCPRCRVEFGAEDSECRVCGAERPPKPAQADPRA